MSRLFFYVSFPKKKIFSGVLVGICGRDLPPSSFKPDPYLDQPWFHTLLFFSDLNIYWMTHFRYFSFFAFKQIKSLDVLAIPFKPFKCTDCNGSIPGFSNGALHLLDSSFEKWCLCMAQVYFEYILFLIDLFHSLIFSRTKEEDQHHVKKPQTCCICPIGSLSAEHKNKTCTDVGGILF